MGRKQKKAYHLPLVVTSLILGHLPNIKFLKNSVTHGNKSKVRLIPLFLFKYLKKSEVSIVRKPRPIGILKLRENILQKRRIKAESNEIKFFYLFTIK